MANRIGDKAVVIADNSAFEDDAHCVPLQTVVTVEDVTEIKGRPAYRCNFYNNGAFTNYFYPEELAFVD